MIRELTTEQVEKQLQKAKVFVRNNFDFTVTKWNILNGVFQLDCYNFQTFKTARFFMKITDLRKCPVCVAKYL